MLRKLNQFDRRKLRVRRELDGNAGGPAPAIRAPHLQAYLRPGDRRRAGAHRCRSLQPGEGHEGKLKTGADKAAASAVGKLLAERATQAGVKAVVFDRGGYKYHGRIKALADGAREGGLSF